jgi:hypothetical protein
MLAGRIGPGVDLRPLAPGAGRRVVGVRFVDHDAVARVDPDVAGEEHEVAGLALGGGHVGQGGLGLLGAGAPRAQHVLAVDDAAALYLPG